MTFEDLGLRSEFVANAAAAGYPAPTPLQATAAPVVRRGGNVVLRASAGAGVVGAYALGVLNRIMDAPAVAAETLEPAALVLAPTRTAALTIATSAGRFARGTGARVAALAPGWDAEGAALLVATPSDAMEAVAASRLKFDALLSLVVDGAAAITELDGDALETLTASVPGEAQRIVVGHGGRVADYVARHARKAMTFPPLPADRREAPGPRGEFSGAVAYAVTPEPGMLDAAARLMDSRRDAIVLCRSEGAAETVKDALALRGYGDARVVVGEADPSDANVVSFGPPFDADGLVRRHAAGGAVIAAPRHLPHLRSIAAEAGAVLEPLALPEAAADPLDRFRSRLAEAARSGDLAPQLLVLEPMLGEFSMAELAAAATLLARESAPPPAAEAPAPAQAGPPPGLSFTRLFVSAGARDHVGPGDVLGAITGEAGVAGDQVGKIDIGDTFTIVEVDQAVAARVIDALNGTTLRGRSLRVDYDRKGGRRAPPGRRPGRG